VQRDTMRWDRKRERERDQRLEVLHKKTKTSRDRDRDVTERIALGMSTAGLKPSGEGLYDARLFNQVRWARRRRCRHASWRLQA
jgi:SNW domain-containing protein 1